MKTYAEIDWPPVPGESYLVQDDIGEYVEIFAEGAFDGAKSMEGERRLRVVKEQWNADFTRRTILRVAAITAR
jgi:hypothetical protein